MVCVSESIRFNDNLMINLDYYDLDFQKLDHETYEDEISFFMKIINQLNNYNLNNSHNLNLQDNDTIKYFKKLVENLIKFLFKGFEPIHTVMYDNINSIAEYNALNYLEEHRAIEDSLLIYANKIRSFLRDLGKYENILVHLQKSPENPDFNLIILNIQTEFADLEEKKFLSRKIGKLLDDVTDDIAETKGNEMYDHLSRVTYTIEEIND